MFDRSSRYYLGFDRIPRERRRGDHGRAILKKGEIREPNNQRWKKNEPTNDQLISTTGYESPWSTNGDTDRLPGISGGDAGFCIGNRPGFGRRRLHSTPMGPSARPQGTFGRLNDSKRTMAFEALLNPCAK